MRLLAADYPLLDVFWTMLWFFVFILWIWVIVGIITDIFRSHDLGGFSKAFWLLFVIFLPILGVLAYLIARGSKMHEHAAADAQAQDTAFRSYVQEAAGGSASELSKLADLRDRGVLTEEEFQGEKARILASA
jgi:hypothetical protein